MPLTLVVRRFDPVGEGRAYLEAFEVDAPPGASVLDALLVAATTVPSLAFRRMCRTGVCGTCGVTVNGRPVLACRAAVDE
ncbi:MAG TPA: 2Fe-2S iron-sulfur cluster-binding protein, partial [Thermodesulfobacteriota bacterium]